LPSAFYSFCEDVNLPTTLADIGLGNADRGYLMQAAEKACAPGQPIHHEAGVITPGNVLDAMLAADALGQDRRHRTVNRQAGAGEDYGA
jgi:glycerol dehydrogenase